MSRKARVEREIAVYRESCISRVEPEKPEHKHPCEHAPDGNMIWGDPPEAFCRQCIHYQRGHVEPAEDDEGN